jgi:hypothetical protein
MNNRRITITEWARVLGVSRPKVYRYLALYQEKGGSYNSHDMQSVLSFYRFLMRYGYVNLLDEAQ